MKEAKLHLTIDDLANEHYPSRQPGAAVILVKEGRNVFRRGYGMANLELNVPVEPSMVFRLGSVTKQFTAVAIMILLERNEIALSDSIARFIPDFPTDKHVITVEHLLTHTAGILNYTDSDEWSLQRNRDLTPKELIAQFIHEPPRFVPGQRFSYSNSGYILLGAIIEEVAGVHYRQFIHRNIFNPLGMRHSYYDMPEEIIPGRVPGYERRGLKYENAAYISMTQSFSAGGLASTLDDLALWDSILYTDQLVARDTLRLAFTPFKLAAGESAPYGFGWQISDFRGRRLLSHNGDIDGFVAHVIRVPDGQWFAAVLSNNHARRDSPRELATAIVGLALAR